VESTAISPMCSSVVGSVSDAMVTLVGNDGSVDAREDGLLLFRKSN
jgi:hypothetical protein